MTAWNRLLLRSKKMIKPNPIKSRYVLFAAIFALMFLLMRVSSKRPYESSIVPAYPFEKDQTGVNSLLTKEEFKKVFQPPLLGNEKRCSESTTVLVALNSAAANHLRRQAIRETWSQLVRASNQTFLFFVAEPSDAHLRHQIELESQTYQDIVLLPVRDSYYLLTFKILAVLNWAAQNCPKLAFVMKCDDDFYVNWPELFGYMADKDATDLFYGRVNIYTKVHRNVKSRWYMPESEYPASDYPIYLSGSPLFIGYSLLPKLLRVAWQVKPLYIDDMWISGILRMQIPEAKIKNIPNVFATYAPKDEYCLPLPALAVHGVDPPQMHRFYENQLSGKTNSLMCSLRKSLS